MELDEAIRSIKSECDKKVFVTNQMLSYSKGLAFVKYNAPITSSKDKSLGTLKDLKGRLIQILEDLAGVDFASIKPLAVCVRAAAPKVVGEPTEQMKLLLARHEADAEKLMATASTNIYLFLADPAQISRPWGSIQPCLWPMPLEEIHHRFRRGCKFVEIIRRGKNMKEVEYTVCSVEWDMDAQDYAMFYYRSDEPMPKHFKDLESPWYFKSTDYHVGLDTMIKSGDIHFI